MGLSDRRVVFTGLGIVSAIGNDPDTFWKSLCDRKTGIQRLSFVDPAYLKCKIGAEIKDFDPKKTILDKEQRKALNKLMSRSVQMGLVSATEAFRNAGLVIGQINPDRSGVVFGAGMIATELDDLGRASKSALVGPEGPTSLKIWGEKGIPEVPPLWMLKYLPNMPSCHVSITHDLRGPSNTITESDAASMLALGEAYHVIQRGLTDLFMVGGTESKMNPLSQTRNNLFQQMTTIEDSPETALRPFDIARTGTVMGEGSASFAVEALEHAQGRGAKILAELVGFACGFDKPRDGSVMALVMERALQRAGISPGDIDHVNAQGMGYASSDNWEAKAILKVFGPKIPVWAMKPNVGNTGAASSALELAGSMLALQHQQLPPTLNFSQAHPDSPLHVNHQGIRPIEKPYALKISFTDMGQVGVAVIRRWQG